MSRQRFVRQARATAELPIVLVSAQHGAQLARMPGIERQRAAQLDIGDLKGLSAWALRPYRRQRHFENGGGRQYRHALDRMIGEPRQHFGVEMIQPERHRPRLPKSEQRMRVGRIGQVRAFDRMRKPAAFSLPRIERQAARIGGPVEPRRAGHVGSRDVALCGQSGKRVLFGLLAAQRSQDPALAFRRAECIVQIGLQHRVGADLDKDPDAVRDQCGGRVGKPDRRADVVPPIFGAELPLGNRLAGHR